jgi:hypothetical protein
VAFVVRRRWQDAVEAQKSSRGEKPEVVTTKWHTASLLTVGVLLVLTIAGIATA